MHAVAHIPLALLVVWSLLGPVPMLEVPPLSLYHCMLNPAALVYSHLSTSKSQSLEGGHAPSATETSSKAMSAW